LVRNPAAKEAWDLLEKQGMEAEAMTAEKKAEQ
jgi:hypothetical protein